MDITQYLQIKRILEGKNVTLVAVSKFQDISRIQALYEAGQRDFGENYVQELLEKQAVLPKDIRWHFIGHLQTNKVKFIAPFVHLIHGIDSGKLLREINKQGAKLGRAIPGLLQVHIAQEETKFGLSEAELEALNLEAMPYVRVLGLMGMASFSSNKELVRHEFASLKQLAERYRQALFSGGDYILSMGMSDDHLIAIEEGSNMVRIGSLIFGARQSKAAAGV